MKADIFDLRRLLDERETAFLSPRGTPSRAAVRRRPDPTADQDHRQNFAIDADRILHSLAYTRYIDKTQVFYLVKNDHITHRVLHVQLVSRIARTIGRHLGLNEDLIEAISLGHDLGHAPFGHDGEIYLSRLCQAHGLGHFLHAVQSLEFLEHIERKGRGVNLSLQVLDGILAHDGEVDLPFLRPEKGLTFGELDRRLEEKRRDPSAQVIPMTAEGCVVRLADTISYVGRDMEDAIRLGLIERRDLPAECAEVLGDTNGKIVYRLVVDLISASKEGDFIAFSPEKASALMRLKNFNREKIYFNPLIKKEGAKIELLFQMIFHRLLEDLQGGREESPVFARFLIDMAPEYSASRSPAAVVRDFMAGMTDEYFLRLAREILLPKYHEQMFV